MRAAEVKIRPHFSLFSHVLFHQCLEITLRGRQAWYYRRTRLQTWGDATSETSVSISRRGVGRPGGLRLPPDSDPSAAEAPDAS